MRVLSFGVGIVAGLLGESHSGEQWAPVVTLYVCGGVFIGMGLFLPALVEAEVGTNRLRFAFREISREQTGVAELFVRVADLAYWSLGDHHDARQIATAVIEHVRVNSEDMDTRSQKEAVALRALPEHLKNAPYRQMLGHKTIAGLGKARRILRRREPALDGLASLQIETRLAFVFHSYLSRPLPEIAEILGRDIADVQNDVNAARERMDDVMNQQGNTHGS
jgi:hypothetical protein